MLTVKPVCKLLNVWWPEMDYKHTCDTIFTRFQGITNNIYGFGRPFFAPSFLLVHPYFYPSIFVFTRPNDGWTGLYIKLCWPICLVPRPAHARDTWAVSVSCLSVSILSLQDIMGMALHAPLTSYKVIYTLPMMTIKQGKGEHPSIVDSGSVVFLLIFPTLLTKFKRSNVCWCINTRACNSQLFCSVYK